VLIPHCSLSAVVHLRGQVGGDPVDDRQDAFDSLTPRYSRCVCPPGAVDTLVPAHLGVDAQAVVREAVNNTVRHGRSTAVTLTVDAGDELVIEVVDNGIGILAGAARSGLRNLDDRARECGGQLVVHPGRPAGPA